MCGIYLEYSRHKLETNRKEYRHIQCYPFWSLIQVSIRRQAVKYDGFRHCSGFVVAREVGWYLLNKDSFNIKICRELNAHCELQTQRVPYVVFTRQRSEALKYMLLPLSTPWHLRTWEIKSNKFKFPVNGRTFPSPASTIIATPTILVLNNSCCSSLKRSLDITGECFLAIYTSICTDIKIWQSFQEVIPFLQEAAAHFSDFWHSINKIKEKNKLELALTNYPVVLDRMFYCLAMYHKIFDAQCISFVSAQCLGSGLF